MINAKITSADLSGKGVVGLSDAPGLSTADMQRKFDELALDVLVPKHNDLIDDLSDPSAASGIGASCGTVQDHISDSANPHSVTAYQTGAYSAAETDMKISERIVDIGSSDMTKAQYDQNNSGVVDDSDRLGGKMPGYFAKADDAFSDYVHSKSGTVHSLIGNGENIKFIATADFKEGDAFVIDGTACTAKTINGEELFDECFVEGSVVTCNKNGAALNFQFSNRKKQHTIEWIQATLQNTFDHGSNPLTYAKTADDWVQVNGTVRRTTAPTGSLVITTLPAGYRPTADILFPLMQSGAQWFTYIYVRANGVIQLSAGSQPAGWSTTGTALISASFKVVD